MCGYTKTDTHTHSHRGIPAVCWLSRHHCWPPKGHLCLSLLLASLLPETQKHSRLVSCWNTSRIDAMTCRNRQRRGDKQTIQMENERIFVLDVMSKNMLHSCSITFSFFLSPLSTNPSLYSKHVSALQTPNSPDVYFICLLGADIIWKCHWNMPYWQGWAV